MLFGMPGVVHAHRERVSASISDTCSSVQDFTKVSAMTNTMSVSKCRHTLMGVRTQLDVTRPTKVLRVPSVTAFLGLRPMCAAEMDDTMPQLLRLCDAAGVCWLSRRLEWDALQCFAGALLSDYLNTAQLLGVPGVVRGKLVECLWLWFFAETFRDSGSSNFDVMVRVGDTAHAHALPEPAVRRALHAQSDGVELNREYFASKDLGMLVNKYCAEPSALDDVGGAVLLLAHDYFCPAVDAVLMWRESPPAAEDSGGTAETEAVTCVALLQATISTSHPPAGPAADYLEGVVVHAIKHKCPVGVVYIRPNTVDWGWQTIEGTASALHQYVLMPRARTTASAQEGGKIVVRCCKFCGRVGHTTKRSKFCSARRGTATASLAGDRTFYGAGYGAGNAGERASGEEAAPAAAKHSRRRARGSA